MVDRFFLPNGKRKWTGMRYLRVNDEGKLEYFYQIRDMFGRKIADVYDGNFYGDETIEKRVTLIANAPKIEHDYSLIIHKLRRGQ